MHKKFKLVMAILIPVLIAAPKLEAQANPGCDLTIKIAILGPEGDLYSSWGHICLIIENVRTLQNRLYDFGLFFFESDTFFRNLASGKLIYSSGVYSSDSAIAYYAGNNRDIMLYTLDLSPESKEMVRLIAEEAIQPQNKDYLYHFFKENCSTRIRNIIDDATSGQFGEFFRKEPGSHTYRQLGRRSIYFLPLLDFVANFFMGRDIDAPISAWDEMFVPGEVGKCISNFNYKDESGNSRKLVSKTEIISQAQGRPIIPDQPGKLWPPLFALGLLIALVPGIIFFIQTKYSESGQAALGIFQSLFGLIFGMAGSLLFYMSFFTAFDFSFNNANLLFCNPLLLAAIPLGINCVPSANCKKRLPAKTLLRLLWLLVLLGIFASMLLKLLPQFRQDNLSYELLILPTALIFSLEPAGLKRMIKKIFPVHGVM